MATARQSAFKAMGVFDTKYKKLTGKKYVGNRNADAWPYITMVEDLGITRTIELIDHFLAVHGASANRADLAYRYTEYDEAERAKAEDEAKRAELRRLTKLLVEQRDQ